MKKVLTIGLMLLACAGFVFAEIDSDNLTVKLSVASKDIAEWFVQDTAPTEDSFKDITKDTEDSTSDTITFTEEITSKKVYPAVLTNNSSPLKITITGSPLTSTSKEELKLSVVLTPDAETSVGPVTWSKDGGNETKSIVFEEGESISGKRVFTRGITVSVISDEMKMASAADDYEAVFTMTVDAK